MDVYRRKPFYFFRLWFDGCLLLVYLIVLVPCCILPVYLGDSILWLWIKFSLLNKKKRKKCWTQNFERLSCLLGKPHRGYYGINVSIMACVVYYSQEVFKRAILQPGPPQTFALQTVQEVIKPQVIHTYPSLLVIQISTSLV